MSYEDRILEEDFLQKISFPKLEGLRDLIWVRSNRHQIIESIYESEVL